MDLNGMTSKKRKRKFSFTKTELFFTIDFLLNLVFLLMNPIFPKLTATFRRVQAVYTKKEGEVGIFKK
jgi:hypothetical protein